MGTCRVENCENAAGTPGSARGLCRAHYKRWHKYGDENEPSRRVLSWKGDVCASDGCVNKIEANGLCENHYKKIRRAKDPEGNRRRMAAFKARKLAEREQAMGRSKPAACELCGGNHGGICFDHDHKSGAPRGWLCDRCNKTLGLVYDDVVLLAKMIGYLEVNRDKTHVQTA